MRRTKAQMMAEAPTFKAGADAVIAEIAQEMVADMKVIEKHASAQGLALRIWRGQSPDLVRAERIKRIAAGLEEQGFSMDGVELP